MQQKWKTAILALLTVGATISLARGTPAVPFQTAPTGPANKLIVYGDMALFQPPGHPDNCVLRNRFKRGEPVGWRMFVADPQTGNREESAQLVVHLTVAGIPGAATESIGDAFSKTVIISARR